LHDNTTADTPAASSVEPCIPSIPEHSKILRAALDIAGGNSVLGTKSIPVVPMHSVKEGRCSCHYGAVCPDAGKHPRYSDDLKHGFDSATTMPSLIHGWFNRWRDANLAIPTGKRSGKIVFDVDPRHGGSQTLDELEREHGPLPKTLVARTRSAGFHIYVNYPEGFEIKSSAGKLGPGLDVRAEGGCVLVPTSAGYGWEQIGPTPDIPESWLNLVKEDEQPKTKKTGPKSRVVDDGGTINEGGRNRTLTSICGSLHDGTRDLAQLTTDLAAINEERCEKPLPHHEVEKIAKSIHRKEPCRTGKPKDPEVEEVLEAAGRYWYDRLLRKGGRSKARDVFRACIGFAGRRGQLVTIRVNGEDRRAVKFSASCRQLALEAATSPMSVSRNTKRLKQMGALRGDAREHASDSGALLIIEPLQKCYIQNHSPPTGGERGVVNGCNTSATPPRPDKLRTPAPRWHDPVGNARAGTLYALEAFGQLSEEELADRVGIARAYDLVRRHLEPLEALGLVECHGNVWSLPGFYVEKTTEVRRIPYTTSRRVRRRHRTPEGRRVVEVVETVNVASVEQRDRADRERYAKETIAFREHRTGKKNRTTNTYATGPSDASLADARHSQRSREEHLSEAAEGAQHEKSSANPEIGVDSPTRMPQDKPQMVDNGFIHPPECSCEWCSDEPEPRYAKARSG
jgi:Bifunctional DNA primase/polymerase, N-terminal/Primase C terminal 1 (PriCT-1)